MAASSRPKRGSWGGQDQARKRHQNHDGGRWERPASRLDASGGQPPRDQTGRLYARERAGTTPKRRQVEAKTKGVGSRKAYDSKRFRQWLRSRRIKPTIPPYERRERKHPRGRPVKVGTGYEERWKVDRTFAWLGSFRRLLVSHERYLSTFRAFIVIAFILVSLRRC